VNDPDAIIRELHNLLDADADDDVPNRLVRWQPSAAR
jgi:hypothetical protein